MGLVLGLLLATSLLLRGWGLPAVPPELFGDELDVGYQAYSLLTTGRDLYGQPLPLYLHSLSEWRLPLIVYHTVPSVALLGLTEAAVRLPEVIMGALASLIVFALTYQLIRSKSIAFTAAILVVVLPWHFLYSRMAGFGVVTQANFIMLASLLYLRRRQVLSAVFFGLALYTYGTSLVFIPLWLVTLWLIRRRPISRVVVLTLILAAPLIWFTLKGPAATRFSQLSVFSASEVMEDITTSRARHPGAVGRLFYNRPVVFSRLLVRNYLTAFSPEFLFLRGDPVQRHSLQIVGGLYPWLAPFLILGILVLISRRRPLLLLWLLLAPLPSVLTLDGGYHATRLFLMVSPLVIIASVGLQAAFAKLSKITLGRLSLAAVGLLALYSLARVGFYYFSDYPILSWRWWQIGYRDTFQQLSHLDSSYSRVFINNTYEPSLIRFLFWTRYPPSKFHRFFTLDQPTDGIITGYDGFSLEDKYFFGQFSPVSPDSGITRSYLPGALYLVSQRDDVGGDWDWRTSPPANVSVLYTSTNQADQPLFYLVTRK